MLHIDIVSRIISLFFKIVSTLIILLIILTLSEPYADQEIVLKKGNNANHVICSGVEKINNKPARCG